MKRRKFYGRFKDNISPAQIAEMGSLPLKIKNVKYLLCVIDVLTKYAWIKSLKDGKRKQFLSAQ